MTDRPRTMIAHRRAMPEWLGRDDRARGPWTVLPGSPHRGEAYTDVAHRRMQVPEGDDDVSRCIRAHELMHAKVSPASIWVPDDHGGLDNATVVAAEEFRVNMLVKSVGFAVDRHLADGSEKRTGERLAANADWNAVVLMLAAVVGTRSERPFLEGVRAGHADWVPAVREIQSLLRKLWRRATRNGVEDVASTRPWGDATIGWKFTLEVAGVLQRSLIDTPGVPSGDELRQRVRGTHRSFAPLVELPLPMTRRSTGGLGHRSSHSATGRHLRHVERLLTDPDRRVFSGRRRALGGTVLIDQSGSMRLDDADLRRIMSAAPGCTVIGYSHRARMHHTPNIWILAQRGHLADDIPAGNGGNGVDGPALRFAATRSRQGDPFIWVCDGFVTDDHDNFATDLADECARLVIEHRVHQVADVDEAIAALAQAARGRRLPTRAVGPVASAPSWSAFRV
ncbi:MAG: hypothetical protein ACO3SP_03830 [Ilumatobacteraceae bacterium]